MATNDSDSINSNAQKPQSMSVGETSGSQVPIPDQIAARRDKLSSTAATATKAGKGFVACVIKPGGTV